MVEQNLADPRAGGPGRKGGGQDQLPSRRRRAQQIGAVAREKRGQLAADELEGRGLLQLLSPGSFYGFQRAARGDLPGGVQNRSGSQITLVWQLYSSPSNSKADN